MSWRTTSPGWRAPAARTARSSRASRNSSPVIRIDSPAPAEAPVRRGLSWCRGHRVETAPGPYGRRFLCREHGGRMRDLGAAVARVLRRYNSDLVCSHCGAVIAHIDLRPYARPRLQDPEGRHITPSGGMTAMGIAQTRLAGAEAANAADRTADHDPSERRRGCSTQRRVSAARSRRADVRVRLSRLRSPIRAVPAPPRPQRPPHPGRPRPPHVTTCTELLHPAVSASPGLLILRRPVGGTADMVGELHRPLPPTVVVSVPPGLQDADLTTRQQHRQPVQCLCRPHL